MTWPSASTRYVPFDLNESWRAQLVAAASGERRRRRDAEVVVGRERELAALLGVLEENGPRVCFVYGIPGIGKSSLLAAFAEVCSPVSGADTPLTAEKGRMEIRARPGTNPREASAMELGDDDVLNAVRRIAREPGETEAVTQLRSALQRYGVTVNAIAPGALTRLTEDLGMGQASEEAKAAMSPRWIAPLCTWLASPQSAGITGRVFESSGRVLAVAEGLHRGPTAPAVDDPAAVDEVMRELLGRTRAPSGMDGNELAGWEGR